MYFRWLSLLLSAVLVIRKSGMLVHEVRGRYGGGVSELSALAGTLTTRGCKHSHDTVHEVQACDRKPINLNS